MPEPTPNVVLGCEPEPLHAIVANATARPVLPDTRFEYPVGADHVIVVVWSLAANAITHAPDVTGVTAVTVGVAVLPVNDGRVTSSGVVLSTPDKPIITHSYATLTVVVSSEWFTFEKA